MKTKHKTVRMGQFESNSSSTSAYSVYLPKKTDIPEFKPYIKSDKLEIPYRPYSDTQSWIDRVQFLTGFLSITGRVNEIPTFMEKISKFAEISITMINVKDDSFKGESSYEDLNEYLDDSYYSFCNEYGHDSVEDFKDTMNTLLADDDLVLAFVFSSNFISEQSWYNG